MLQSVLTLPEPRTCPKYYATAAHDVDGVVERLSQAHTANPLSLLGSTASGTVEAVIHAACPRQQDSTAVHSKSA